jgi:hypothetical protein
MQQHRLNISNKHESGRVTIVLFSAELTKNKYKMQVKAKKIDNKNIYKQ